MRVDLRGRGVVECARWHRRRDLFGSKARSSMGATRSTGSWRGASGSVPGRTIDSTTRSRSRCSTCRRRLGPRSAKSSSTRSGGGAPHRAAQAPGHRARPASACRSCPTAGAPWAGHLEGSRAARLRRGCARTAGDGAAEALALLRPVIDALAFAHRPGTSGRPPGREARQHHRRGALRGAEFAQSWARGQTSRIAKSLEDRAALARARPTSRALRGPLAPMPRPSRRSGRPARGRIAVGLVLTEMLTGSTPYPAADTMDRRTLILSPMRRRRPASASTSVGPGSRCWQRPWRANPRTASNIAGELLDRARAGAPAACHLPRNVPGATELAWIAPGLSIRWWPPRRRRRRPRPTRSRPRRAGAPPTPAPAGRKAWAIAASAGGRGRAGGAHGAGDPLVSNSAATNRRRQPLRPHTPPVAVSAAGIPRSRRGRWSRPRRRWSSRRQPCR